MNKHVSLLVGLAACLTASAAAFAQGLTAVKPIPGYACMRLKVTPDQAMDRSFAVPVFASPSKANRPMGNAAAIVIVRNPPRMENGFEEILFLDGRTAWIESKWLMPFPTAQFPRGSCTPSIMSNGRIGFDSARTNRR